MPNWCNNGLTINGDAGEIAKFREWLNNEPLTLQKILPLPVELADTVSPTPKGQEEKTKMLMDTYGATSWYDWRVNNWGTKWDVDMQESDFNSDDTFINYQFDSAWSPPSGAIVELGKLFPNLYLRLNYREDGMQFAGVLTVRGGEINDICYDGGQNDAAYRAFLIAEYADDNDQE
jgi:hypothetical protein